MVAFLALLLLTGLLVAVAACWKRLLGLAVSRFANGRAFRLTVGEFFLAGAADVRLLLHVGPVREVRIARLAVRFANANAAENGSSSGGGSCWPWQALLNGHLLLPISLQGVSLRLAPPPPKPAAGSAELAAPTEHSSAEPLSAGGESAAATPSLPVQGLPHASGSATPGKKGRPLRLPLAVLANLPVRVEGLAVLDEERGVQLQLQLLSLSLHGAQQLLRLEGLAAGLVPSSSSSSTSSSASLAASAPGSPTKAAGSPRKRAALQQQALLGEQQQQQQQAFFRVERLLLEHQHDGSFSLHHLSLSNAGRAAAAGSAAGTGAAAVAGSADGVPDGSLQRVVVELGAVSLTVSKPLLAWAQQHQHQAAASAAARRHRAAAQQSQQGPFQGTSGADKQLRLLRLLELLPREAEVAAQSCTIATDGSSGTSSASAELPLSAAFGLRGIRCRLAKAAPAAALSAEGSSSGSTTSSLEAALSLATLAAGWQQLAISLGASAATGVEAGTDQPLPSAVAVSSGAAEWSLALSRAPAAGISSSSSGSATVQVPVQLAAVGQVRIGALHTNVCHPAVQPLVTQLKQTVAAAKSALRRPAPVAAGDASAEGLPASFGHGQVNTGPLLRVQHEENDSSRSLPLLAEWQATVRLGDGSRLLFTDAVGRCCWSSGLASCRLAMRGGAGSSSSTQASSVEPATAAAAAATAAAPISGSFEVVGIEMHAVTTARGSLAGLPAVAEAVQQPESPPQMLAARLLRVEVQHGRHQQKQEQQVQPTGNSTAVDATTSGVHLLVQQQQLATVASVIVSLLPPCKEASQPSTPEEAAAAADSLLQAASRAAVAAAAAAVAAEAAMGGASQRRALPGLSFTCSDTLLLLPTTVTAPAEHCSDGQLLLLPAAPALLLSSVSGSLGGGPSTRVYAEGCCLLYCEGTASQRFPSSSDVLKEQAKAAVLSIDDAVLKQAGVPAAAMAGSAPSAAPPGGWQLEIGAVAATADPDALLCLAAVADGAAHQLALALHAVPGSGGSSSRSPRPSRRSAKQQQQQQGHSRARQLSISLGHLRVAQPLCPGRDMALEVQAVHAVVGAQQGCRHSASTAAAVLTIGGKPVIRWRHLAASLALPEAASGHLPARPLSLALPPGSAGRQAQQARGAVDPFAASGGGGLGFEAYQRARLEAWLDADSATAPTRGKADGSAGAAAAAALGSGPASVLDATLSGAELIVPHDGEPGPSQRYCELYLKALETAMEQHLRRLKQLKQQRSAAKSAAAAAAAAAVPSRGDEQGPGEGLVGEPLLPGGPKSEEAEQEQEQEARQKRIGGRRSLFPMQINLEADDVALRFEHHPMEAWLATRGPLLKQMAVQQHLWGEVAAAVQPADSASPLHAAMVESAFSTVAQAAQQAWDGLMQDLFQLYRSKLRHLEQRPRQQQAGQQGQVGGAGGAAAAIPPGGGAGGPDLVLIACSRLRGLAVLCAGSEEAGAAAQAQIVEVDPASQRVPMAKMLKLHADVVLDDFAMRLAGASSPFVAAAAVRLSGTAAVARQASAPPQITQRRMPVGAHRSVPIPVTVKGCRPVFKFYTDLGLDAEALSVCHSQGLEPALALMGLAGKRLSPGDPDKTAPRPPPIPWWDDLRYMWRGQLALAVRRFELTLGGTDNPDLTATSERMVVEAADLQGRLLSGNYELGMTDLRATLHRGAGVQQLGGTLLALPFVHAPRATVKLRVDFKLPGGRPAEDHHLFPRELPPPGTLQEPIYAGVVYKAEGMDLSLSAELGQLGSTTAEGAAAVGFIGGHQIQWMKQYVSLVSRMPPQIRMVNRRGTYFWRKPPSGVPKKGIGKLLQQLSLHILAAPLDIVHFAADPEDCSHGIRLRAPACTYTATYLLNQPVPSFLKLPPHVRKSRRPEPTRSLTLDMDVKAGNVTVHKAAPDPRSLLADPTGSGRLLRRSAGSGGSGVVSLSQGASPGTASLLSVAVAAEDAADGAEGGATGSPRGDGDGGSTAAAGGHVSWAADVMDLEMLNLLEQPSLLDDLISPVPSSRGQQPIIAAGTVAVTQDPLRLAAGAAGTPGVSNEAAGGENGELADPVAAALGGPQARRPLRVLISDCRVMVDQAARDAVWGAVEHLISAFTSSGAQQRRNLGDAAHNQHLAVSLSPSPTMLPLTTSPSMPWSSQSPAAQLQRHISRTPTLGASVSFEAAIATAASASMEQTGTSLPAGGLEQQQQQQQQAAPGALPSRADSSNELLALLLEQQATRRASGSGGSAGEEGASGDAGDGLVESPTWRHPGVEGTDEEEEEDEPLSSPADDRHGQLQYIVEVVDLQIDSETESAQGRLLLAARSCRLEGLHISDTGVNVTALLMEQVSAYVAQTDVDPDAPVLWMQPTPSGYTVPQGQAMVPIRRIFDPIQISLRHSKVASGSGQRRRSALSSRSSRHRSPGSIFGAGGTRGEELLLRVPEVVAALDSREFEVLVEVISMLQNPGPSVETVGAEAHLLAELEGEEVEEARRLYALLRQQLWELRKASQQLRTSLGLQPFTSHLAAPADRGGSAVPALEVTHFLVADSADFVATQFGTAAELAVAMREHLASASAAAAAAEGDIAAAAAADGGEQHRRTSSASAGGAGEGAGIDVPSSPHVPHSPLASPSPGAQLAAHHRRRLDEELERADQAQQAQHAHRAGQNQGQDRLPSSVAARRSLCERQREQEQALLLRWVEEQEGGAFEALQKAKTTLLAHKAIARKRQQKHSASRVLLQVDRVVWRMCTPSREPFTQISIRRLTLDKFKQKDHSGFAKFAIHRIEVLDNQGVLGPGPGIGAGVILSVWNPDASWERDDMLRVVATMGVPTQTHVVYDHLDVILHPIAFHLTEGLAVSFWEYFFPREDEAKARAAAVFARSVAVPAAAAVRHRRSATALPDLAPSQQGSPMSGSPMRRQLLAAAAAAATGAEGSSRPGSGGQSPLNAGTPRSGIVNAGWRSAPTKLHRKPTSASESGSQNLSRQGTFGASAAAAAAAAVAETSLLASAATALAAAAGGPGTDLPLARTNASLAYLQRGSGLLGGAGTGAGGPPLLERSSGNVMAGGRLFRPLSCHSIEASEDTARPAAVAHRKVRFVHVKINRAHCRATYEGKPVTFNDLKLVIDNRTYSNIEGRWRDLFNKMKWDTVKSVVKSVAGLQGWKFKELLPEGYPGEGEGDGGARRKPGLLKQLKEQLGKGSREGGTTSATGEPGLTGEELRAQHKYRMLVGQAPAPPRSAASTPAGAATTTAAAAGGGGGFGTPQEDSSPAAAAAAAAGVGEAAAGGWGPPSRSASVEASALLVAGGTAGSISASATASAHASPRRQSVDEVAASGEAFPPPVVVSGSMGSGLAAAAAGPAAVQGPLGQGLVPFGSGLLLPEAPPLAAAVGPSDSSEAAAAGHSGGEAYAEHPAAVAVAARRTSSGSAGSGGGSGSSRHLPTPRWAKQLASKAQKGLNKLRDSLQD